LESDSGNTTLELSISTTTLPEGLGLGSERQSRKAGLQAPVHHASPQSVPLPAEDQPHWDHLEEWVCWGGKGLPAGADRYFRVVQLFSGTKLCQTNLCAYGM